MPIGISNGVLNQKNAPAIYEDIFANRPAAGFSGRIFIATDTSQIFVDNGTTWVLIANTGIGSTGTLQVVTTNGNTTSTGITITAGGLNTNAAQISGLTQTGGVLFTDGSGNLGQDVNFNWDITNNYLGIGQTGTPTAPLDIHNGSVNVFMQLNATATNNSTIAFQNASVGKWRIGNLYSTGANLFHIYNNAAAANALTINASNASVFTGSVTGSSIIKSGGTSSEFLKADGSVDSSSYITLASLSGTSPLQYNNTTGAFTILQSGASQAGYLSSTDWNTFNNKAGLSSFSASLPLSYNNSTGAFSIQVATSGQNGYLTSTDWNTFNNKQTALTFGNLTETVSSVLTIAGGTGAVIGTGTTIQIKQSSASQSGYLSSTDWTTFNNKQTQINGTGFVKASGTTISYDNSTYYLASNPSGYITLSSLTGTTPITYNNGTGAISIAQSGTSSSGYLSSTDWNTFNSKASLTAFSASPPLSYNNSTGAFTISQATGSTNGYLSSTDWTTFNNKQSALTNPITGTGTSGYVPKFNGTTSLTNSIIQDSGTALTINGLVGIGGTAANPLDVFNNGDFNVRARSIAQGGTVKLLFETANNFSGTSQAYIGGIGAGNSGLSQLIFATATNVGDTTASEKMRISNSGNVGINTQSPSDKLNVVVSSNGNNSRFDGPTSGLIIQTNSATVDIIGYGGTTPAYRPLTFSASASVSLEITTSGIVLVNTTTDNGSGGVLQANGMITASSLSASGTTYAASATVGAFYYHVINGGSGVNLTLLSPSNNNRQYVFVNTTANTVTITAATSTNIINLTSSSVSSITLLANQRAFLIADGNNKYYQIF